MKKTFYSYETHTWYTRIDNNLRIFIPSCLRKQSHNNYYLYRGENNTICYKSSPLLNNNKEWRFTIPYNMAKALDLRPDDLMSIKVINNEYIITKEYLNEQSEKQTPT